MESVTKQEFATATQELTLRPLGLTQTSTEFDDHTATPYTDTTPPKRMPYKRLPFLAASGGYYSNATDLLEAGHKILTSIFSGLSLSTHSPRMRPTPTPLAEALRTFTLGQKRLWQPGTPEGQRDTARFWDIVWTAKGRLSS